MFLILGIVWNKTSHGRSHSESHIPNRFCVAILQNRLALPVCVLLEQRHECLILMVEHILGFLSPEIKLQEVILGGVQISAIQDQ